jgi:FemAB-related protein (PEP-CTERM system-associated)
VLESLLDRKGALSRQIGEAKRSGEPIDALLEEMRAISTEIKSIKSEEQKLKEAANPSGETPETIEDGVRKAKLFVCDNQSDDRVTGNVRLVDDSYAETWDQYVQGKSNSSIYHLWAFRSIIQKAFGHNVIYLAAFDDSDKVCGVLPAVEMKSQLFGHFIVSMPFFTYGAVLAENESIERSLCASLVEYAKAHDIEHVELRTTYEREVLLEGLRSKEQKVSMVRELPSSVDQLWQEIGSKVRAQVKKAQRYKLVTRFGKSELVEDFYTVFSENMRDLGTPVYSKRFFSELMESALSDKFDIGVVYFENKPVACCFLMQHKGMMEIPWASTLQKFNTMNVNMFMYWDVLQKAIGSKCQFFDFGRSSKDAGTYRFKKQWGARPQQLYWYYWLPEGQELPELNPNNPKYKLLISVWQRLPVWLTKIIGPPVVKYLP